MDDTVKFGHHKYLQQIADEDVAFVLKKDVSYGASWRWSGGANAWAMVRRKIDRLMEMLKPPSESDKQNIRDLAENIEQAASVSGVNMHGVRFHTKGEIYAEILRRVVDGEDIFVALRNAPSGDDGTVLAEIRDLRRYLLLLEAGMMDDLEMSVIEDRLVSPGVDVTVKLEPAPPGALLNGSIISDSSRHAAQACDNFVEHPNYSRTCMNCLVRKDKHRCNCDATCGENRYHEYGGPDCIHRDNRETRV